jgi:hypothetical protein
MKSSTLARNFFFHLVIGVFLFILYNFLMFADGFFFFFFFTFLSGDEALDYFKEDPSLFDMVAFVCSKINPPSI